MPMLISVPECSASHFVGEFAHNALTLSNSIGYMFIVSLRSNWTCIFCN